MPYNSYLDVLDGYEYLKMLFETWARCFGALKNGGRLVVNVPDIHSSSLPLPAFVTSDALRIGFKWMGTIIWYKHNFNSGILGSYGSPSAPKIMGMHEYLLVFCKGTDKHEGNPEDIDITKEEWLKYRHSVWEIPPESKWAPQHPAVMPITIAERVIKLFTYKNDWVLDPYNGIGTTTAAAYRLHRNYVGIELDPEYCKIARTRLVRTEAML